MGDLILINGEVKEAWRRLVKVLSKAMTGRTVEWKRESKCVIRRNGEQRRGEGKGEGDRERERERDVLVCVRVYAERLSNFLPVTMRSY